MVVPNLADGAVLASNVNLLVLVGDLQCLLNVRQSIWLLERRRDASLLQKLVSWQFVPDFKHFLVVGDGGLVLVVWANKALWLQSVEACAVLVVLVLPKGDGVSDNVGASRVDPVLGHGLEQVWAVESFGNETSKVGGVWNGELGLTVRVVTTVTQIVPETMDGENLADIDSVLASAVEVSLVVLHDGLGSWAETTKLSGGIALVLDHRKVLWVEVPELSLHDDTVVLVTTTGVGDSLGALTGEVSGFWSTSARLDIILKVSDVCLSGVNAKGEWQRHSRHRGG